MNRRQRRQRRAKAPPFLLLPPGLAYGAELAFGLTVDGHSWPLRVKADCLGFKPAVGRAFRSEMLRAALDEAVWTAWRAVNGTNSGSADPRIPEGSRLSDAIKLL